MNKFFLILFLIIVLVAVLPRAVEVISGNYLFGFDQGLFFEDVKKIVVDHKPTLIGSFTGGQGGLFQGPGWYYLLSVPFFITGGDPMGGMVLMFIMGILTVVFSIFLGSAMFDKKTGLILGFLIAVSPAVISQSRFIWPPFPVSLLTVFYLFFIFRVFQKKEKYLPLAVFTIGLMSHFELATAATFFAHFLLISPFFFYKKLISVRIALFSIIAFAVTLSPLIIFNFRHDGIIFKGVLNMLPGGGSEHSVTSLYIWKIFQNHLDVFKFNFLSSFHLSNYLWPVLLGVLAIGGLDYIRDKKIERSSKLFMLYLLTTPITLFVVFMLYLWPMWEWWILQLIIFYNFAFGILSLYLFRRKMLKPFIIIIYLLFLVVFINQTIHFYKVDFKDYGGTQKIKGKIEAIDFIYQNARASGVENEFGLLVFTPPVYTFAYDYLIWWYGERYYGYIPHKEKKGTFYLLIEKDPHKEWSYRGWLETVIKTGRVEQSIELQPSGFIIEKRVADEEDS